MSKKTFFRGIIANILLMTFSIAIYSQDLILTGRVIDQDTKKSIQSATIYSYRKNNIIYKTLTDSSGFFKIPYGVYKDSESITISSLNYQSSFLSKDNLSIKNSYLGTFEISSKNILLKEVVIKNRKRYSDTTVIDLSKNTYERSVSIDQVFNGSVGFSKDNGILYYKGKAVEDILVNGDDFFGKNNLDIFQYVPALTLDNIEIINTNIDSITNTIMFKPRLKVNLKLRDKFIEGKFGNGGIGGGSLKRYFMLNDLYSYKHQEQLSLHVNSNNINLNSMQNLEPRLEFSPTGNNVTANNIRFGYRNVYKNKLEVSTSISGLQEIKEVNTESEREDKKFNQFSSTSNSSIIRTLKLENINLKLNYKVNDLNSISMNSTSHFTGSEQNNISQFTIINDGLSNFSHVHRIKNKNDIIVKSNVEYKKRFSGYKGRLLIISSSWNFNKTLTEEDNDVLDLRNLQESNSFFNNRRIAKKSEYVLISSYTNPIWDDGYIESFLSYKKQYSDYSSFLSSDTVLANYSDIPLKLQSSYSQAGIRVQKNLSKASFEGGVSTIFNFRQMRLSNQKSKVGHLSINSNFKTDYKINDRAQLVFHYEQFTTYPDIDQLTSINNSFDPISQTNGNINLRPEVQKNYNIDYNFRKTDSLTLYLQGRVERYKSKWGFNINGKAGETQNAILENTGNTMSGELAFGLLNTLRKGNLLNYFIKLNYRETPVIINNEKILNNTISINQTISTSKSLFKNIFSVSPNISFQYNKYVGLKSNAANLVYSDNFSLRVGKLYINTYPLINYNFNISSNMTWAVNGEIKINSFKDQGKIFIKMYDVFKSFKLYNNTTEGSYIQSVKYSNLNRYVLLGASLKFNNMK